MYMYIGVLWCRAAASEELGLSTGRLGTKEFSSQQVDWQPKNSDWNWPQQVRNSGRNLGRKLGAILHRNVT